MFGGLILVDYFISLPLDANTLFYGCFFSFFLTLFWYILTSIFNVSETSLLPSHINDIDELATHFSYHFQMVIMAIWLDLTVGSILLEMLYGFKGMVWVILTPLGVIIFVGLLSYLPSFQLRYDRFCTQVADRHLRKRNNV